MKNLFILILLEIIILSSDAKVSYENYKVYSVIPKTDEQVQVLIDLNKENNDLDFWSDVFNVDSDVRVMVSSKYDTEFIDYMKSVNIDVDLKITNVQELIDAQMIPVEGLGRNQRNEPFNWERYHNLDEIYAWLDELADKHPSIVSTVISGTTHEGRPIKGVVINFKPSDTENRLIGMIEGGIHAREWISPATVTYIINEFLHSTEKDVRFLAEHFVWHIFPVSNPDGYVYTYTTNRMWRKNRNPENAGNGTCAGNTDDDMSVGIDLNRNFGFVWGTEGVTWNPCGNTYPGPRPNSEAETQAIFQYLMELKKQGNVIYYLAFHSFSQMILVPYSHVRGIDVLHVDNYGDLYEIAIRGADKLRQKHGTEYTVGVSAEILYAVSGSSFDWAKGFAEIPIVYLFELRDTSQYGFLLPAEQIIPNSEEIMDCLVEMDRVTRFMGYYSGTSNIMASIVLIVISFGYLAFIH